MFLAVKSIFLSPDYFYFHFIRFQVLFRFLLLSCSFQVGRNLDSQASNRLLSDGCSALRQSADALVACGSLLQRRANGLRRFAHHWELQSVSSTLRFIRRVDLKTFILGSILNIIISVSVPFSSSERLEMCFRVKFSFLVSVVSSM